MRQTTSDKLQVTSKGMSLLEVVVAMTIVGLVTGGIFSAFVFARSVSYRATSQLVTFNLARGVAEELRLATGGAGSLNLAPGVYIDPDYDEDPNQPGNQNPPNPCGATITRLQGLKILPDSFRARYKVRRKYYVEDAPATPGSIDADCDGIKRGKDFDGNGTTDLKWTKIIVDWEPPKP